MEALAARHGRRFGDLALKTAPSRDEPTPVSATPTPSATLRPVVARVAGLNLAYFGIEITVALAIGSLALIADSLDFLEDAAINLLIFAGIGWSVRNRARLGAVLAVILLLPALATGYAAWIKFATMAPPAPIPLTLTGLGALAVNLTCAMMLARHRSGGGSLTRAAYLSARNDAFANLAIIAAGLATALTLSAWPDLIAAAGIAVLNADSASDILKAARAEWRAAKAVSETPVP
jgi:Co/Zn/Cd efflux system component